MAGYPKLETLDSREIMGAQKISVSGQTNSSQFTNMKPDGFVVDMERLSYHADKDLNANSRFILQRSLSRKGSQLRGSEKKINTSPGKERDSNVVASASPRAALVGVVESTPEKTTAVTVCATAAQPTNPQPHHQITIVTGNYAANTAESKSTARRSSFRRSASSWTIDPRRILLFFATLSSVGTILLIYLTLSMRKHSGDESALNW